MQPINISINIHPSNTPKVIIDGQEQDIREFLTEEEIVDANNSTPLMALNVAENVLDKLIERELNWKDAYERIQKKVQFLIDKCQDHNSKLAYQVVMDLFNNYGMNEGEKLPEVKPEEPATEKKKRSMSPEARARISESMKARWSEGKMGGKKSP